MKVLGAGCWVLGRPQLIVALAALAVLPPCRLAAQTEDADGYSVTLQGLQPGMYRVRVRAAQRGETAPTPVRDVFEIAGA